MGGDRGGQIDERVELLELTGAGDCQQPFDGTLALVAPSAEHDFLPLNGRPEGSLGGVVGGRDAVLVHEGEEVQVVHEERVGQVADVVVGGIEIPLAACA